MKAISFIARSGTGKTTLLTRLIPELRRRGYRVGAMKHHAHQLDIDHPGKDSHRLTEAGAEVMVIASADKLGLVRTLPFPPKAEELVERYFPEMDVVLVEGFGAGPFPVIEVRRAGAGPKEAAEELRGKVVAVASDRPQALRGDPDIASSVPVLDIDDPVAIADFIVERVLR